MTNLEKQQEKIKELESSIKTARDLIKFFENHEGNLQAAEKERLIAMLEQELHVHKCWLASEKSATGW